MLSIAFAGRVGAVGVEDNAGLRLARYLGPTRIGLLFGPGFSDYQFDKKAFVYQVVSATDENFRHGVAAEKIEMVRSEPDAVYPDGWKGPEFTRYIVTAKLPRGKAMAPRHKYWIRIGSRSVIGNSCAAKYIIPARAVKAAELRPRYGIRELYVLSPMAIHLITGAGIDVERLGDTRNITITSSEDADYRDPVHPQKIGRRSNLDFYIPKDWPWQFRQRHELFLILSKPMTSGHTYTINLNAKPGSPVTCGLSQATLRLNDRATLNLAIKVNQIGYLPGANKKYGYLGMWQGDLGAYDFGPYAKEFEVRDAASHAVFHRGKIDLRRRAIYKLVGGKVVPDPQKVKGPETVYKQDLSYEDVYQLDLSALIRPGTYYVAIPGMGRSFRFRVAEDVYSMPFRTIMHGLFHQRCGIELNQPWTKHYRPACHRNNTEYSTAPSDISDIGKLPDYATNGKKHDLWGGHHDAGDWNPRSHLEVAEVLMLLYEMNKPAFSDGQLVIPENSNRFPDVLDEAWWALDLWNRLQDADGGVHARIETNGDPHEGDEADTDSLREFAYRKEPGASYWYAANAAHASILWKELGRTQQAAELLARAVRAWRWAEQNGGQRENDRHVHAAATLLRATGDARYDAAFKKHSVIAKDPSRPPQEHGQHDQIYGSYHYAMCSAADPNLKSKIVTSFEQDFRFWARMAETTTYRYMRSPYAPNTWGTGGLPVWLIRPAMTMQLSQNPALKAQARRWVILTCDFSLGCHPLNQVFTVGLGKRYVTSAFSHLMSHSPEGIIPGLQTEAAGGRFIAGEHPGRGGMGKWPGMSLYPPGPWPDLYKYSENASPGMNEGTTFKMVQTAFAYGLLLSREDAPPDQE